MQTYQTLVNETETLHFVGTQTLVKNDDWVWVPFQKIQFCVHVFVWVCVCTCVHVKMMIGYGYHFKKNHFCICVQVCVCENDD